VKWSCWGCSLPARLTVGRYSLQWTPSTGPRDWTGTGLPLTGTHLPLGLQLGATLARWAVQAPTKYVTPNLSRVLADQSPRAALVVSLTTPEGESRELPSWRWCQTHKWVVTTARACNVVGRYVGACRDKNDRTQGQRSTPHYRPYRSDSW